MFYPFSLVCVAVTEVFFLRISFQKKTSLRHIGLATFQPLNYFDTFRVTTSNANSLRLIAISLVGLNEYHIGII